MNDRELYQQKKQAQLDEWQSDVDNLKAKASGVNADAQMKLNKQIGALDDKIEEGNAKLVEIGAANDDTWESLKDGADSTWNSIKSAFSDTMSKFKS